MNLGISGIFKKIGNDQAGVLNDELNVLLGSVPGAEVLVLNGYNPDADSAAAEDVWSAGETHILPTSAVTLRIRSGGNSADAAAGTGARTVRVWGLDADGNFLEATLTTNGASASTATASSFLRVNGAEVVTAGSGLTPAGNVILETTGGDAVAQINAGDLKASQCRYSVPAGHTALLVSLDVDSSGAGVVQFYHKKTGLAGHIHQLPANGNHCHDLKGMVLQAGQDLSIRFHATADNTKVAATLTMLLVKALP